MKKIIKSLPLLLPLFSLVACDSYGPEIEKARATTLYAKASKQETIAQTINMSLKGSQYEADGGTGNSSKKVTSTMDVKMSLDMEKMYLHYTVKAADIEEQGGKRKSKESADIEEWVYYSSLTLNVASKISQNGKLPSKEVRRISVENMEHGRAIFANLFGSASSTYSTTTSFSSYKTLSLLEDSTMKIYPTVINSYKLEFKNKVNGDFDAKYYSKNENNLTIKMKDNRSYSVNKTYNSNYDSYSSFSYGLLYTIQINNGLCTKEDMNYSFKAKTNKSSIQYETKTNVKIDRKLGCNVEIPKTEGYIYKL